jgi:AraC-like DNA-binding protein
MKPRRWTKSEERLLAKWHAADVPDDEIGQRLERSESSVKAKRGMIGCVRDRWWTPEQIERANALHGKLTAAEISAELGKSVSSVYQLFYRLGLTQPRWTDRQRKALRQYIRTRYREQWSDTEIAEGWSREHPERTVDRGWVSEVRRQKLKLSARGPWSDRYRRRVARKTKEQLRKAGLPSIGYLRLKAFEEFAVRQGWPALKRPRLVQIMNLLYENGPHTRPQIAAALGLKWGPKTSHPNGTGLAGNGPGGSYLAELQRLKLVVRMPRTVRYGPRKGQARSLYAIAPGVVRGPICQRSEAS